MIQNIIFDNSEKFNNNDYILLQNNLKEMFNSQTLNMDKNFILDLLCRFPHIHSHRTQHITKILLKKYHIIYEEFYQQLVGISDDGNDPYFDMFIPNCCCKYNTNRPITHKLVMVEYTFIVLIDVKDTDNQFYNHENYEWICENSDCKHEE